MGRQKKMHKHSLIFVILITLLGGYGCTGLNPLPNAARSGDTIALAVGSPVGMTRANTTATFTSDSDGIPVDITPNIRAIFKLYADKTSNVYEDGSNTASLVESAGHEQWVTVVALDLPTLPVGPGVVKFTTTATYPPIDSHINNVPIPLEILAGEGSSNSFPYQVGNFFVSSGNLGRLEALPQAVFAPTLPSAACPCPDYGAIEVKVHMPTNAGISLPEYFVKVNADDLTVKTESSRSVAYGLVNGEDLTVILTSLSGKLQYYEARFSVALRSGITFSGTPSVTSIRYFDVDGTEISGPQPSPTGDYNVVMM